MICRLKLLMKRNPNDPKVYFTMGMLEMDRKNYLESEKYIKKSYINYLKRSLYIILKLTNCMYVYLRYSILNFKLKQDTHCKQHLLKLTLMVWFKNIYIYINVGTEIIQKFAIWYMQCSLHAYTHDFLNTTFDYI